MRRQSGGCVFDENGKLLRGTLIRHLVLTSSHIQRDSFEILKRVAAEVPRDVYISLLCQYFPTDDLLNSGKYPKIPRKLKRKEIFGCR